jgi:TRAP-type C4-dicarboxylate transport system permease small subunit
VVITQAIRFIVNAARIVGGSALVVLMVLFCTDVVARYFFGSPIDGVLEITTTVLLPLVVFVGMCVSIPDDVHVRMGIIYDKLPGVPHRVLRIVALLLAALLWAAIAYYVGVRAIDSITSNEVSTVSFALPIFWGYLIVSIGSVLMAVVALLHLFVPEPETSSDEVALDAI